MVYRNARKESKNVFLCIAMLASLVAVVAGVLAPIILKKIIDSLSAVQSSQVIFTYFAVFATLLLLKIFASELKFYPYAKWEKGLLHGAYQYLFEDSQKKHFEFYLNNSSSKLVSYAFQSVMGLKVLLFDCSFHLLPLLLETSLILASVLYIFGVNVFLILLAGISLYVILAKHFSLRLVSYQNELRDSYIDTQSVAVDLINANKDIKLFNSYHLANQLFSDSVSGYADRNLRFYEKKSLLGLAQNMPLVIVTIFVNYYALKLFTHNQLSIGDIALINTYLFQILKPLETVSLLIRGISRANSDFALCEKLLYKPGENLSREIDKARQQNTTKAHLSLKGVKKENILHNINLKIYPGEKVALIGSSGSGKSTLANIIMGLERDYEGSVTISQEDIKTIPERQLRDLICFLPCNARLIEADIMTNILFGKEVDELHNLENLLEGVCLTRKINDLTSGLKTLVNENTNILSAGEKQRIKIARVLARDAKIQIYDEATSHLDSATETKILKHITAKKDKTVIFITHNAEQVVHFDKVYKIEKGAIELYQPQEKQKHIG